MVSVLSRFFCLSWTWNHFFIVFLWSLGSNFLTRTWGLLFKWEAQLFHHPVNSWLEYMKLELKYSMTARSTVLWDYIHEYRLYRATSLLKEKVFKNYVKLETMLCRANSHCFFHESSSELMCIFSMSVRLLLITKCIVTKKIMTLLINSDPVRIPLAKAFAYWTLQYNYHERALLRQLFLLFDNSGLEP